MDGDSGADQRQTISILEAAKHTGLWDENGELIAPTDELLKEYHSESKGKERRCTFFYTGSDGAQHRCALFGNILSTYMAPRSILNLAYTAIQSSPTLLKHYKQDDIARSIDTIQNAIGYMYEFIPFSFFL
jgi:hypothetical protein